jgi:hypothetical protein
LAGLKLPKFHMPTAKPNVQKAGPAFAGAKPHAAQATGGSKAPDALGAFKTQLAGGQVKPNLNQPKLPETAVKTQKFGGWVG